MKKRCYKKKCRSKSQFNCNLFEGAVLPPCTKFLGGYSPLIKDGKFIYPNYNRLFLFLTYNYPLSEPPNYDPKDITTYSLQQNANLQISLYDFLIGLFINEVQKDIIKYDSSMKIHDNKYADRFIKTLINANFDVFSDFIPSLSFVISNSNAILSLYTADVKISPINFYIIFMLNRIENEPALKYGNNCYVTPDYINYELANLFIKY
ncbi:hypothetical protein C3495_03245 [Clostridiaceae bacterium 14S0207]|nr:hypothetical protein C3495_03245 [Clostridiaceae bacterium 14S0207]